MLLPATDLRRSAKETVMYGNDTNDPIVKYYDETLAVTSSGDIAWFVEQAQASGGHVLDLACGTGRVAIALAEAGLNVAAVDSSLGMLQAFRDKLSRQPKAVQSLISIHEAEMHSFDLPESFSTVVCCDAFFHNLTVDDQISCLRCIASHLVPDGRVVFNIPNPAVDFLSQAASPEAQEFKKRNEYTLSNTNNTVLVEQTQRADLFEQTIMTTLRFTRFDAEHNPLETNESSWTTRFTFRYEAVHLLYRCGFEIESLVGNYRGAPVTEDTLLVFIARLAARNNELENNSIQTTRNCAPDG
jgi:2-polyprenyl-3-methyl-5-hydroxy-6-metoxy-1,4-benzoquinol methylase